MVVDQNQQRRCRWTPPIEKTGDILSESDKIREALTLVWIPTLRLIEDEKRLGMIRQAASDYADLLDARDQSDYQTAARAWTQAAARAWTRAMKRKLIDRRETG